MPWPTSLVVKNGSNALAFTSRRHARAGIGDRQHARTGPGTTSTWPAAYCSSRWTLAVSIVSLPPFGIASRALTARLRIASSSWLGSAWARHSAAASTVSTVICSPERPPQQVRHAGDQPTDIDRLRIERLLPRKGEQALRQRFRAPRARAWRCSAERLQPLVSRSRIAQVALQRFEIADDDGQQVVEVVRDAAGELADAFHLLRLPQPLFGGAPFGQIARDLGEADQLSIRVLNRIDDDARPEPAAVLADAPAFGLVLAGSRSPSQALFWDLALPGLPACRTREKCRPMISSRA